jgi:aspartate 1-decarboxylase
MNGAAAHLMKKGDKVIIACFVSLDERELRERKARKVFVDGDNRVIRVETSPYGAGPERCMAAC